MNARGSALLEVLVATAILATVLGGVSRELRVLLKQESFLRQKLEESAALEQMFSELAARLPEEFCQEISTTETHSIWQCEKQDEKQGQRQGERRQFLEFKN